MARYYKYKTVADLQDDAKRLGQTLAVSDDFSPLFQPIMLGTKSSDTKNTTTKLVGNRLCIQPMEGCDGTTDGKPDELTFRRYQRFGAGGAKLIWGEAAAISEEARANPRQLQINEFTAASLEKMLTGCRTAHIEEFGNDNDFLVGLQLTHSGRYSFQKPLIAAHDPQLDPLTRNPHTQKPIDDSYPLLTDDQLKQIEDDYLTAAKLAAKIGFDFIDLKQCHRYLLSELLSATTRPGEYGGDFENRTRLVRNVIQRIQNERPELMVASRMNAFDGVPFHGVGDEFIGEPYPHTTPIIGAFGTNPHDCHREELTEPILLAKQLRDWGVSLLNVSAGNPYASPHYLRPAEFAPVDGYQAPEHPLLGVLRHFRLTNAIQSAVPNLPVVGSGYSWLQDFAMHAGAANIAQNATSFVGMGRATLSHPDFAKTLQQTGQLTRKKVCRTFSYCTNLMRSKDHPLGQYETGCPPFDKEIYAPLWKEAEEKQKQKTDKKKTDKKKTEEK